MLSCYTYAVKLFKHQEDIINEDKKRVGLFLGTGASKTLTALKLAKGRTLVITPKILKEEEKFKNEAKAWNVDLNIDSYSKEQFKKHVGSLSRYDTVIIDEAHTVAGATPDVRYVKKQAIPKCSKLFESVYTFIKDTKPDRVYLLTATPTRTPMCVWALARLLGHNWNFYEFRDKYYFEANKGYRKFWIVKNSAYHKDELGRAVRNIGYTGKLDDYFDVPKQSYKVIKVEPTKEQKKRLKEIMIEEPNPIVNIGKQHQIENGVLKGNEYSDDEWIKDNKIEELKSLALEFPKMIIFARYKQQIEKIRKELNAITITGETKDREKIMQKANESDECILVIQSQISAGYELPSFPVVVFASMSYSVVDRIQAEGRVQRANNLKHNLYIDLITRGGIDEAVLKSINNKVDFSESIYAKTRI